MSRALEQVKIVPVPHKDALPLPDRIEALLPCRFIVENGRAVGIELDPRFEFVVEQHCYRHARGVVEQDFTITPSRI